MTVLIRTGALVAIFSAFNPLYAQSSWHDIADSAYQFQQAGKVVEAHTWAIRAAQAAQPADPTDSLWQVAVRSSRPLADSVRLSTLLAAGRYYLNQNNIEKARSYLVECQQQGETLHLPTYYLDSYAALAQIATRQKEYSTAQQLYKKIIADSFALKQPIWKGTGLAGLAETALAKYKIDSASRVARQALAVIERLPNPEKIRSYPQALRVIAITQCINDSLPESIKTIDRAYVIVNRYYSNDLLFVSVGSAYAYIYGDVNDEKALEATDRAQRTLRKQVNYQQYPYYLKLLSDQVGLLQNLDRSGEASVLADSVFERHSMDELCRLSRFDDFLNRALRIYLITGQPQKAEPIALQAQRLLKKRDSGGANPSFLNGILGRYSQYNGKWPEAIQYYKEEIRLDSLDKGVSYLRGLNNRLAICQAEAGQRSAALATFSYLVDQFADNIHYNLWMMTESERLNNLSTTVLPGLFWYVCRYAKPQPDELALAYNYKLLLQGASLRTSRAINHVMHERSRVDGSGLQKLIEVQSQLANTRSQLDDRTRQRLISMADSLNRQLGDVARLVNETSQSVNWTSVQARLKPDEAAIEIIRYDNFLLNSRPADSTFYAALIVRPGWLAPRLVVIQTLGNSETAVLSNYFGPEHQPSDQGETYSAIWQPISTALGPVKRVYIAVDGIYQMISLPTLLNTQTGKHLLDETEIVVLNSTQDLLDMQPYTKPTSAELIGHPAYRIKSGIVTKRTTKPLGSQPIKLRNGLQFDELPYTKVEVEQLARQFRSYGIKPAVRTDANATEKAVYQWQSPTIVHIATHGFLRDSSTKANSTNLQRCGLALAGAADTTFSDEHFDGILTGYEASLLNLYKTELVVLSACQTGAGDYVEGEGVYGLQRAFMLAGSKAVLMSLWDVGDRVTQRFMTVFYKNWLSGLSKPVALRQTQRQLRKEYPQAYVWGAFVLLGQ